MTKKAHTLKLTCLHALRLLIDGRAAEGRQILENGLKIAESRHSKEWIYEFAHFLGMHWAQAGNLELAKTYYEMAQRSNPSDFGVYYLLSEVYEQLGLPILSLEAMERCLVLARAKKMKDIVEICQKHVTRLKRLQRGR
jgi:tetratricopeptide (TPR) repeat protein